jgi:serine/threonine protein kinase
MVCAGTPAYMAPEQALGKDPTAATDIYALGIILYEMVTGGERPFTGEKARTGSTSEKVRWEKLNIEPPSPSVYNPKLSPELEAVILKCLEKDPAKRFQSPLGLLEELENALGFPSASPSQEDVADLVMQALRFKEQGDREGAIIKYNQALEAAEPEVAGDIRTQLASLETGSEFQSETKKRRSGSWYWIGGFAIIAILIALIAFGFSGGLPDNGASIAENDDLETQVAIGVQRTEEAFIAKQTAIADALESSATEATTEAAIAATSVPSSVPTAISSPSPRLTSTSLPTTEPEYSYISSSGDCKNETGNIEFRNNTGEGVTVNLRLKKSGRTCSYYIFLAPGPSKFWIEPGFYTIEMNYCGQTVTIENQLNSNWFFTFKETFCG